MVAEAHGEMPPVTGWESPWVGDMDNTLYLRIHYGQEMLDGTAFPVDDFPSPVSDATELDPKTEVFSDEEAANHEQGSKATIAQYD